MEPSQEADRRSKHPRRQCLFEGERCCHWKALEQDLPSGHDFADLAQR